MSPTDSKPPAKPDAPTLIDPGTPFDPQANKAPAKLSTTTNAPEPPPEPWTVGKTRKVLKGMSRTADRMGGWVVKASLEFTDDELDDLAQPITNIINRRPVLMRLADQSDTLLAAMAVGGYFGRVMQERAANILDELETQTQPAAGYMHSDFAQPISVVGPA